jgi:hypothetical protein
VVDKKNKALELLKGYEVLKETERLNMEEEADEGRQSKMDLFSYNPYKSPVNSKQR